MPRLTADIFVDKGYIDTPMLKSCGQNRCVIPVEPPIESLSSFSSSFSKRQRERDPSRKHDTDVYIQRYDMQTVAQRLVCMQDEVHRSLVPRSFLPVCC